MDIAHLRLKEVLPLGITDFLRTRAGDEEAEPNNVEN